jgi:ankyrin repeat protein
VGQICTLLNAGVDADAEGEQGLTPLMCAAREGNLLGCAALLRRGAKVDTRSSDDDSTALHLACLSGHLGAVDFLLTHGANGDAVTTKGISPLAVACGRRHAEVVRLLLRKWYAPSGLSAQKGAMSLYTACQLGDPEIAGLLLAAGASAVAAYDGWATPLFVACLKGHLGIVELLMASSNSQEINGEDITHPLYVACQNGSVGIAELLLRHLHPRAGVDLPTEKGGTAMLVACQEGRLAIVELLLSEGSDVVNRNVTPQGHTPLHIACKAGRLGIVEVLLRQIRQGGGTDTGTGTDTDTCIARTINRQNKAGATPLNTAADCGHAGICKLMLSHGAEVGSHVMSRESAAFLDGVRADAAAEAAAAAAAEAAAAEATKCEMCGGATRKKCAGCRAAYYCCDACQLAHWQEHKQQCRARAAEAAKT